MDRIFTELDAINDELKLKRGELSTLNKRKRELEEELIDYMRNSNEHEIIHRKKMYKLNKLDIKKLS